MRATIIAIFSALNLGSALPVARRQLDLSVLGQVQTLTAVTVIPLTPATVTEDATSTFISAFTSSILVTSATMTSSDSSSTSIISSIVPDTVSTTSTSASTSSTIVQSTSVLNTSSSTTTSTASTTQSASSSDVSSTAASSSSSGLTTSSSFIPASATSASATSASATSAFSASSSASATPIPSSASSKFVVAHMMVGNTFPFTKDTWKSDIQLAQASGIDGFALNVGTDEWQPGHVADAYAAAEELGTNFKLFMSFDMSVNPCSAPEHAASLRKYITDYAAHPNQLKVDGKVFASTFAGESCTFGQSSVATGWSSQFTRHPDLSGANAVHFVPSFFIDPNTFNTFGDVMDGAFNFNSGWPITLTAQSAAPVLNQSTSGLSGVVNVGQATAAADALSQFVGSTDTDDQYRTGLAGIGSSGSAKRDGGSQKTYMAAASPWFFTHYGADSFNKNFLYLADSHLYPTRWEKLIGERDKVDIVELVTWNDYGESHYLKDPTASDAQPNSQAWVDGMSHAGWLDMTAYYASAFKTGSFPDITEDKVYLWARPHARDASAASDPVGKPSNFQLVDDALWAVVFAKADGKVVLSTQADGSNGQEFAVQKGVNKLSVPISAGGSMKASLTRGGATVLEVDPEFTFQGAPQTFNYNAFVAFGKGGSA